MQIDVYFRQWEYARESMRRGERILERQVGQLEELCMDISHSEYSAVRQISRDLRKQQELLRDECHSIKVLEKTLEKIQYVYERTEEAILDAAEPEAVIHSDSIGMRDLKKLQQLAAPFFE